jgi:hypothetical protein
MRRSLEFRLRRLERRFPPPRAAPCKPPLPEWLLEHSGYRYDRESGRIVRMHLDGPTPNSPEWIESWNVRAGKRGP